MTLMEQKDPDMLINLEYMHSLMLEADCVFEREAAQYDTAIQHVDHDEYDAFEAEKQIQDVVHKYAGIVMERSEREKRKRK